MDFIKELAVPMFIALASVALTIWASIHIKYSETKDEAISNLKLSAIKITRIGLIVCALYLLYGELSSTESLTRPDVFKIVLLIVSLALLVVFRLMKETTAIQAINSQIHKQQLEIFKEHLEKHHSPEEKGNDESLNN